MTSFVARQILVPTPSYPSWAVFRGSTDTKIHFFTPEGAMAYCNWMNREARRIKAESAKKRDRLPKKAGKRQNTR